MPGRPGAVSPCYRPWHPHRRITITDEYASPEGSGVPDEIYRRRFPEGDHREKLALWRVLAPYLDRGALDLLLAGKADYLQGSRWMRGGRVVGPTGGRGFGTRLYSVVFSVLAFHRVTDATNGFRAIGVAQLKKLGDFVARRRENFAHVHAALDPWAGG